MNAITLTRVDSWTLATTGFDDGQPRVRDLELAEHLGYERPRAVRELIARLEKSGKLSGVQTRRTVRRVAREGRGEVDIAALEYWLTEEQALFVTAKSETTIADSILKEVIRVFVTVSRGINEQRPAVPAVTFAAFENMIAPLVTTMNGILKRLEDQSAGTISELEWKILRREVCDVARLRAKGNSASKGENSERRIIYNKLGAAVAWTGTGRSWRALPASRVADARVALREMRAEALRLFPTGEERQLKLLAGGG